MYQFIHIETYARSASKKAKPSKRKGGAKTKPVVAAVPNAVVPTGMDVFTQADGSKGKKGRGTMMDVLTEALRYEGHCAHVAQARAAYLPNGR